MSKNIILVVSLVSGIAAAFLVRLYIGERERALNREREDFNRRYGEVDVLCFKNDTPAGTGLAKSDLGVKTVPAMGMRGQAVTEENVDDIIGRKTVLGHARGDVVFWSDIEGGNPGERGLSGDIKRQMRAISINCSGAASVSGIVKANDHVDVIGTFTFPQADGTVRQGDVVTSTILQNVLVLATGQATAKLEGPNRGYSTVTLEVSPREAEMLAFAEQMRGKLVLTLRNRNDNSFERELPPVDYAKIREEIETLNLKRQQKLGH